MKCFSFCIKCLLWKLKRCLRIASKETRGKRPQSPAFPSLLCHRAQNLAVSSHNDLPWKRCCFSHCGQGEGYCFSGGQACVYRTKEVHHPASLSLTLSRSLFPLPLTLSLFSVWPARQPAARAVGWFGVDERMECVAPSVVVWGSPLAYPSASLHPGSPL